MIAQTMLVAHAEAIVAGAVVVIRHLTMVRIVAPTRLRCLAVVATIPRALIMMVSEVHAPCSRRPRLVALVAEVPSAVVVAPSVAEAALVAAVAQAWAVAVCAQVVVNDNKTE